MNFVKNNKILFGAFALTILLALVMITLDIWMYSQFGQNKAEVDAKINEYVELTKKTPAPTKKNTSTITYEYKTIQKRLNRLQRQFGKYLRNPFLKFCKTLLDVSQQQNNGTRKFTEEELAGSYEDELIEAFRKYCDDLPKEHKMLFSGQTDAENFVGFADKVLVPMVAGKLAARKGKSPEKPDKVFVEEAQKLIQQAMDTFKNEISDAENDNKDPLVPLTVIPTQIYPAPVKRQDKEKDEDFRKRVAQIVARTNSYQYLMEAMGLPRTIDIGRFQAQLKMAQNNIRLKGLIPGIETIEKESDRDELISNMTFRESDMPVQSRVFYLVRQMQVRYDIFRRFRKVRKIEKFTPLSPLEGEKKADRFTRYVFEIVFLADLNMVRSIMNGLVRASDQSVCYNILYAEFERPVPEDIDKALSESKFVDPKNVQNQGESNEKEEQKAMITAADIIAAGADRSVKATVKFEVLVFTGDDIARTGADAK